MRGFVLFDACILLFIIHSTLPYSFCNNPTIHFPLPRPAQVYISPPTLFPLLRSFEFILHSILHFLSRSSGVPTMLLPQVWDHEILPQSIKIVGGGDHET
jgi:hypothetical protein